MYFIDRLHSVGKGNSCSVHLSTRGPYFRMYLDYQEGLPLLPMKEKEAFSFCWKRTPATDSSLSVGDRGKLMVVVGMANIANRRLSCF